MKNKLVLIDCAITATLLFLVLLIILSHCSCRPCKEVQTRVVDTVRSTVVKRDTVRVDDTTVYSELDKAYAAIDSILSSSKPCGVVVTGKKNRVVVKDNQVSNSYFLGRINELQLTNAKVMRENNELKDKSRVSTVQKTGGGCPDKIPFMGYVFIFIAFASGSFIGWVVGKFLKIRL
jgi:hypothetical protein